MATLIDLFSGRNLEEKITVDLINEEDDFATRIINSIQDGVLAYDLQCRYTLWNPALERLTGATKNQVLGRRAFDLFPFLTRNGMDQLFYGALAGKKMTTKSDQHLIFPSGHEGYVRCFHSPLYNESGEIVGGLGIIRDMTELKRAQEEVDELRKQVDELKRLSSSITSSPKA